MVPKVDVPLLTGNRMPVLGLGTWQLTDDTAGMIAAGYGKSPAQVLIQWNL